MRYWSRIVGPDIDILLEMQDESRRRVVAMFDALPPQVRAAVADAPRQVPPPLLHSLGIVVERRGIPAALDFVDRFSAEVAPKWMPFHVHRRIRPWGNRRQSHG